MNDPIEPTTSQNAASPIVEPTHKLKFGRLIKTDSTVRLAWAGFRRWEAPVWLKLCAVTFVVASWLPIAVGFEMRTNKAKRDPRIHIVLDMANQPKLRPQDESLLFADHRAQRPRVPGTIARGELFLDSGYYNGFTDVTSDDGKTARTFVNEYPQQIQAILSDPVQAQKFLATGQQKFNITCAMCHGVNGEGDGPINERAKSVGASATGWVQPSNMTDDIRRARPDGHLYNTINNGIRKMGGYGTQLSVDERWAVVAYVRTLQLAHSAPKSVLTADQQKALQ